MRRKKHAILPSADAPLDHDLVRKILQSRAMTASKAERIAKLRDDHDRENVGHMPNASCVEVETRIKAIEEETE